MPASTHSCRRQRPLWVESGRNLRLCSGMDDNRMIPLGYLLKSVASPPPDWIGNAKVNAVHSLSGCVSNDFGDYIPLWKHNGWWLFDTAEAVYDAAAALGVSADNLSLFYYEAFDQEYNDEGECWRPFEPGSYWSFIKGIVQPRSATLSGYDVVSFFLGTSPECSPLSCNSLAAELPVNERCLFDSFDDARAAVDRGAFKKGEPGPYRIIAVYLVEEGGGV